MNSVKNKFFHIESFFPYYFNFYLFLLHNLTFRHIVECAGKSLNYSPRANFLQRTENWRVKMIAPNISLKKMNDFSCLIYDVNTVWFTQWTFANKWQDYLWIGSKWHNFETGKHNLFVCLFVPINTHNAAASKSWYLDIMYIKIMYSVYRFNSCVFSGFIVLTSALFCKIQPKNKDG